ncbi:hypothetical protein HPB47_016613, partial [Ixodes persulcatus]
APMIAQALLAAVRSKPLTQLGNPNTFLALAPGLLTFHPACACEIFPGDNDHNDFVRNSPSLELVAMYYRCLEFRGRPHKPRAHHCDSCVEYGHCTLACPGNQRRCPPCSTTEPRHTDTCNHEGNHYHLRQSLMMTGTKREKALLNHHQPLLWSSMGPLKCDKKELFRLLHMVKAKQEEQSQQLDFIVAKLSQNAQYVEDSSDDIILDTFNTVEDFLSFDNLLESEEMKKKLVS